METLFLFPCPRAARIEVEHSSRGTNEAANLLFFFLPSRAPAYQKRSPVFFLFFLSGVGARGIAPPFSLLSADKESYLFSHPKAEPESSPFSPLANKKLFFPSFIQAKGRPAEPFFPFPLFLVRPPHCSDFLRRPAAGFFFFFFRTSPPVSFPLCSAAPGKRPLFFLHPLCVALSVFAFFFLSACTVDGRRVSLFFFPIRKSFSPFPSFPAEG